MSGSFKHTQPKPVLAVENLSKFFRGGGLLRGLLGKEPIVRAVDSVSLEIRKGETLALVGESGSGKSTFARTIMGLEMPTNGKVLFDQEPLPASISMRPPKLRRRMQMIFQDPYTSLNPRWRVGDIIAEPIRESGEGSANGSITDRVGELLVKVGLSKDDTRKYPHEFSGGQRQRIAIARAISTAPAFLVCDEPTSALDVSVQAQILNLMRDLQEQNDGLTSLFISHNLAVVSHIADRVGVMYLGSVVEMAPSATLFEDPLHPYSRMLLASIPGRARSSQSRQIAGDIPSPLNPPSGCAFHPRCPLVVERCRKERPALVASRDNPARSVACHVTNTPAG